MIRAGSVIENPKIGDRIVFRRAAAETDGELLDFDLAARPGAPGPPEHVQPLQEEVFSVAEGALAPLERLLGYLKDERLGAAVYNAAHRLHRHAPGWPGSGSGPGRVKAVRTALLLAALAWAPSFSGT